MTTRSFTYEDALQLLRLIETDTTCRSIRIEVGDVHLALERELESGPSVPPIAAAAPAASSAAPDTIPTEAPRGADDVAEVAGEETVRSPMAGVFYRAAAPGEEPFVSVGSDIASGATIGIVEVMKLMNNVSVPFDGVVTAIHVDDGELVQFDQPLLRVRRGDR